MIKHLTKLYLLRMSDRKFLIHNHRLKIIKIINTQLSKIDEQDHLLSTVTKAFLKSTNNASTLSAYHPIYCPYSIELIRSNVNQSRNCRKFISRKACWRSELFRLTWKRFLIVVNRCLSEPTLVSFSGKTIGNGVIRPCFMYVAGYLHWVIPSIKVSKSAFNRAYTLK